MISVMKNMIIVNNGSKYLKLIERRMRELGVHTVTVSCTASVAEIKNHNPAGFIFSGGPDSVYAPGARQLNMEILDLNLPMLGICYGLQLFAHYLGGEVKSMGFHEEGEARLRHVAKSDLIDRCDDGSKVWMFHGDYVTMVPDGFALTATSGGRVCAIENHRKKIYGLQFHPEVAYCPFGSKLLLKFVDICGYKRDLDYDFIIYP